MSDQIAHADAKGHGHDGTAIALQYYAYADNQIAVSLRQRDGVVLLYLGAVTALFGAAFASAAASVQLTLLLLVPFVSLGASMLVMLHHVRLGALSTFREELHEAFRASLPSDAIQLPPHLDSPVLLTRVRGARLLRVALEANQVAAHTVLVVAPAVVATVLVGVILWGGRTPAGLHAGKVGDLHAAVALRFTLLGLCAGCLLLTVIVLATALIVRQDLYARQQGLKREGQRTNPSTVGEHRPKKEP